MPDIPRERNGGVCIALAGNLFPEVILIISAFVTVVGVMGAIASIVSLALELYDRRNQKKK